ncbi:MAG: hypothetical protein HFF71_10035 [Oscillospiraceae bacterium]|nr:hypothetical protein [Oscillospiraceae bacterium]
MERILLLRLPPRRCDVFEILLGQNLPHRLEQFPPAFRADWNQWQESLEAANPLLLQALWIPSIIKPYVVIKTSVLQPVGTVGEIRVE